MRVVEVFCNSGSKPGVMFSRLGENGVVKDHLSFSYLYSHKEIDYSDNAKLKEQRQKFIHFFTTYGGGVELSEINRVINDTRKLDVIFSQEQRKISSALEGMRLRASRGGQGGSTKEAMDIRSLERQSKAIRDWRAYVNDLFKLWGPGYIDGSI